MKSSDETGGLLKPRGPVCWCYTHTHVRPGTEQPQSCASESPDGPSASPLSPAGCQASGAHRSPAQFSTRSLAGGRCDSSACWRSNANRHSFSPLCRHTSSKKRLSVSALDHDTNLQTHIQKCFEHCDALQCQIWTTSPRRPMFHWQRPLLCHSMRTVLKWRRKLIKKRTAEDGISDEGCGELSAPDKAELCSSNFTVQFYFCWTDWAGIAAKAIKASMYMRT